MPEGDTVWLAAQRLRAALAGHPLTRADLRVPPLATVELTGRVVDDVVSRGKHLLTRLTGPGQAPATLHTHFRMDGSWHVYRPGQRWQGGPVWQVRAILANAEWEAVGYRLPVVELLPTAEEYRVVGHLGPDVLGPDWDPGEAVRRLAAEPDRELGQALLDQRVLAGVGNLYKTELCFLRGHSPWTPVRAVSDLRALVTLAHQLLHANKLTAAQVTTGDHRPGRQHWVFERRHCRRCGSRVATAMQGEPPRSRLAYWCPSCQPGPAPPSRPVRELLGAPPAGRTRYRP